MKIIEKDVILQRQDVLSFETNGEMKQFIEEAVFTLDVSLSVLKLISNEIRKLFKRGYIQNF